MIAFDCDVGVFIDGFFSNALSFIGVLFGRIGTGIDIVFCSGFWFLVIVSRGKVDAYADSGANKNYETYTNADDEAFVGGFGLGGFGLDGWFG